MKMDKVSFRSKFSSRVIYMYCFVYREKKHWVIKKVIRKRQLLRHENKILFDLFWTIFSTKELSCMAVFLV